MLVIWRKNGALKKKSNINKINWKRGRTIEVAFAYYLSEMEYTHVLKWEILSEENCSILSTIGLCDLIFLSLV